MDCLIWSEQTISMNIAWKLLRFLEMETEAGSILYTTVIYHE